MTGRGHRGWDQHGALVNAVQPHQNLLEARPVEVAVYAPRLFPGLMGCTPPCERPPPPQPGKITSSTESLC